VKDTNIAKECVQKLRVL